MEARNEQAIKEQMSYMEFLELLLSDEFSNRKDNGNKKRMQKAKISQIKTLEEYQFNQQPSINKRFIYNLATCEFVRKKENVAFIGPPGYWKNSFRYST
ncbi:ATP-binding protein [Acetivibrio clariflavus]|uniref:ATP-binding protein n=1 Tax=Acetivibrio clariflavus TaxID=288965 RepID=UPI0004BC0A8F|nr:ATP-binding protein [Acetivibrio clariflavus]